MELTGQFISIEEAAEKLAILNPIITLEKLKKYAEPDAKGKRKLPFFKCDLTGRLLIDKALLPIIENWYKEKQISAFKDSMIYGIYQKTHGKKGNSLSGYL